MVTVSYERRTYVWDGRQWYGADDYVIPPLAVVHRLNTLIAGRLEVEDAEVSSSSELLSRAKLAQVSGQYDRALRLARRVLAGVPRHVGAIAVTCSILREIKRPEEALEMANKLKSSTYPPLLTSRAAALCDLDRWEEALHQVRQVLAISRGSGSGEAFAVYRRIKANAPYLFEESL